MLALGLLAACISVLGLALDAIVRPRGGGRAAVTRVAALPAVPVLRFFAAAGVQGHPPGGPYPAPGIRLPGGLVAVTPVEDTWSAAFFGDKQRLIAFIEQSAVINDLPAVFLTRLLRQESGLDHRAVSRVGALGVAQFMPATASERGLADPFNPLEAIPKAAELLRAFRLRFGNLGLAAAAYNAGPQRVQDWLSGRGALPRETRDYVVRITGTPVEDWRTRGDLYAAAERDWQPARD